MQPYHASLAANRGRVEWVTMRQELEALRPEWDALWRSTLRHTPFQSSAWLLPWWDAFGCEARGDRLCVIVVRDRTEQLVGLAPLYSSTRTSPDGTAEIRLIGAGVSDYLDVLARPEASAAVAEQVRRCLDAETSWRACDFDGLRPDSPLLSMSRCETAHLDVTVPGEPCPVLPLPSSREQLWASLGTHLGKDLRYYRRRAAQRGARVEPAGTERMQELLSSLFELHAARWRTRGEAGAFAPEAVRAFHRAAAPALQASGQLHLLQLRIDGGVAAVYYGLRTAHGAYFYLSGFDPRHSSLSPGKLLIAAALEEAVATGAATFDFLRGQEPYKYAWKAIDQPRFDRHIRRPHRTARERVP